MILPSVEEKEEVLISISPLLPVAAELTPLKIEAFCIEILLLAVTDIFPPFPVANVVEAIAPWSRRIKFFVSILISPALPLPEDWLYNPVGKFTSSN